MDEEKAIASVESDIDVGRRQDVEKMHRIHKRLIRLVERILSEIEKRDLREIDTPSLLRSARQTLATLTALQPYIDNLDKTKPQKHTQLVQIVNQIEAILKNDA
jgi:hypothetical protein